MVARAARGDVGDRTTQGAPGAPHHDASRPRAKQRQRGRPTTGITTAAQHDPSNASVSIGWILLNQAPPEHLDSDSPRPPGRVPRHPCLIHPSILQAVLPRTQPIVSLLASECTKRTAGERTQAERIVTRHNPFNGRPRRLGTTPTHLHLRRRP